MPVLDKLTFSLRLFRGLFSGNFQELPQCFAQHPFRDCPYLAVQDFSFGDE